MAKLLWTQKQDVGPRSRFGHAMAFDPNRQRVVLFGGNILNNQLLKDTWEWNGEDWTQVEDIGPSARSGHAMAYDTARSRLVLFGGNTGAADVRDTWEWDGTAWTQVQDTGPSARIGHAMVFDSARGRVLLFGGAPTAGAPLADTWEWDGTDWVQVEDAGPAPRQGHAMAYDTVRSRAVMFGGVGATTQDGLADTWEWDGTVWTQVQDIGPEGCVHGALVFKSSTSSLFGGISTLANVATRQLFGMTWEWNGQHWTARQDIGVGPRVGHAMAFDTVRGRVVLFGGLDVAFDDTQAPSHLKGDTWEHPDAAGGGGGPPPPGGEPTDAIAVSSVDVVPNPVHPGEDFTITVTLVTVAPAGGAAVAIDGDFGPLGSIVVPAGSTTGSMTVQMPLDIGDYVILPVDVTITATGGGVTQSTVLTITA